MIFEIQKISFSLTTFLIHKITKPFKSNNRQLKCINYTHIISLCTITVRLWNFIKSPLVWNGVPRKKTHSLVLPSNWKKKLYLMLYLKNKKEKEFWSQRSYCFSLYKSKSYLSEQIFKAMVTHQVLRRCGCSRTCSLSQHRQPSSAAACLASVPSSAK